MHGSSSRKVEGSLPAVLRNASTASWTWERQTLQSPWAWVEFDLTQDLPRQGDNRVTVRSLAPPAEDQAFELTLTDVDLQVQYAFCGQELPRTTKDE